MSLMVDSTLHSLGDDKLTQDEEGQLTTSGEEYRVSFQQLLSSNHVAFTLCWYYALHTIRLKDR